MGRALVDGQLRRGRRRFAAYIIHAGAVIVIVAIGVSSTMRSTQEVHLTKGATQNVGAYSLTLLGIEDRQEPHRTSTVARFAVMKDGKPKTTLEPRMNQYAAMREPIGSPDVYSTITGDLYLSIMNIDEANGAATVNVIQSPFVGWIWFAVIMMGLGGLAALVPNRRTYVAVAEHASAPAIGENEVVAS